MRLMAENQFDTIYHEHFSYFSFLAAEADLRGARADALRRGGAADPRRLAADLRPPRRGRLAGPSPTRARALRQRELSAGFTRLETYAGFAEQVKETKRKLLEFLIAAKRAGKTIVGYGAPGKGNTLLNYCGIRTDFLDYTVDRKPVQAGQVPAGDAHPHPRARDDPRDQAGLRAHPAVELQGRDHGADGLHPRVGRQLRGAHPRGAGAG